MKTLFQRHSADPANGLLLRRLRCRWSDNAARIGGALRNGGVVAHNATEQLLPSSQDGDVFCCVCFSIAQNRYPDTPS